MLAPPECEHKFEHVGNIYESRKAESPIRPIGSRYHTLVELHLDYGIDFNDHLLTHSEHVRVKAEMTLPDVKPSKEYDS